MESVTAQSPPSNLMFLEGGWSLLCWESWIVVLVGVRMRCCRWSSNRFFVALSFCAGVTTPEHLIGDDDYELSIEEEYERVMIKAKNIKKREDRKRLIRLGFGERAVSKACISPFCSRIRVKWLELLSKGIYRGGCSVHSLYVLIESALPDV